MATIVRIGGGVGIKIGKPVYIIKDGVMQNGYSFSHGSLTKIASVNGYIRIKNSVGASSDQWSKTTPNLPSDEMIVMVETDGGNITSVSNIGTQQFKNNLYLVYMYKGNCYINTDHGDNKVWNIKNAYYFTVDISKAFFSME